MVENQSVEEICNRIREDGHKEADSILDKAERTAAEIIGKGEKERDEVVEDILSKARDKGELERRRLLSGVHIEMKRARLKIREEVISSIMEKVEKSLAEARERAEYRETLKGLVLEGISALGGKAFSIYVDSRDAALARKEVVPAVKAALSGETDNIEDIEVKELEKASLGGARIGVPGGKVIYDNTFEARMYRLRDDIRNIIFEEVFQSGGSEGSGSA